MKQRGVERQQGFLVALVGFVDRATEMEKRNCLVS